MVEVNPRIEDAYRNASSPEASFIRIVRFWVVGVDALHAPGKRLYGPQLAIGDYGNDVGISDESRGRVGRAPE